MTLPDSYVARARLAPAVIAALPALALVGSGAITANPAVRAVGLVAGALGIAVAAFVRGTGRRLEPALWASWGGSPTIRRLRWRERDAAVVARLHQRIRSGTNLELPTAVEEADDPAGADLRYDEVVAALRTRTRDRKKYHLVFHENVEYGFRRNSLGIRKYALAVASGSAAVSLLLLTVRFQDWERWAVSAGIALVAAAYWWKVVNAAWVREAAELYADRLLEAIDLIPSESA